MKRQIISILLALALAAGSVATLAACDSTSNKPESTTAIETDAVTETESESLAASMSETEKRTETDATAATETDATNASETRSDEVTETSSESCTYIATEADTATESKSESVGESESASGSDTESVVETKTETDTESESESVTDTEIPTETESESATVIEIPTETESETIPAGPDAPLCADGCNFKTVKGVPICSVCGYVAPCRGVHDYTWTIDGHWKPACEHCGKKSGTSVPHEFELEIEDEGDLWLYSFVCGVCRFAASEQEVPYEINDFYSAGDFLNKLESTGLGKSFNCQAGIGFTQYSSDKGGSISINILKGAEPVFPSGKFLVMKVRLGASQKNFSVSVKSSSAGAAYTMTFSDLRNGWASIIVDLTKAYVDGTDSSGNAIVKGFVPDAYDNYYLTDLSISGKAAKGESFDVSYVMICDTIEDATAFVEGDPNVYVYNDVVNDDAETEDKVCVDEDGNPIIHEYIPSETGHTLLESCTQCGIAAVTNAPHTYTQMIIDGELTYACSACKWLQFGHNINKYFSALDISSMATTYYQISNKGVIEEKDLEYASFAGKGNTAQVIFSRDNAASSAIEQAAAFGVGKANLFIIRMRTNTPAVSFAITFRSAVTGATQITLELPLSMTADNEWATYIVDLTRVIPGSYVPDENGNFTLGTFYYHIGYKDFTSAVTYDVEYMAFVDQWDEVKALVSDEQMVNVTGSGRGQLVNTADRTCVGEHAYATTKTDDGWKLVCASCGHPAKDFGVGANIEKFMPAEILQNVRTDSDGKIDLAFMEEDGESFIRLSNLIPNGAGWMGLTFVSGEANVTGQYMIMKVRLGENGLGTNCLSMYTGTTVGLKSEGQATAFKMVEDGEWHYVVIDLAARMGDPATYLKPNEDDSYTVKYLQIRPFSNTQCTYGTDEEGKRVYGQKVMEDDYLDIGFIAYCDSLDDFKDIIKTENYEWSVSTGESAIRKTTDHSCVTHSVSVEVTGSSQKAACIFCGDVMRDFTLPEAINWYSTYSVAGTYQATVAKEMYDEETGLVFNRFTGSTGGHLNITGGSGSGTETPEEYKIGKYLVLKYRAVDALLLIRVGTKNETGSYKSLGDYQKDIPGNSWRVAVLNIEEVDAFKNDADGRSTIYLMITTSTADGASSYTIDIAYAAIVDSLAEMKLLLEENEDYYYYGDRFNGDYVVNWDSGNSDDDVIETETEGETASETASETATETVTETVTEVETETEAVHTHAYEVKIIDGQYVYACTCGEIDKEYGVSDKANVYIPAEVLKNVRTDSDGKIDLAYMSEEGQSFIRLSNLIPNKSGWMGISMNIASTGTVTGQYMIMKVRLGENGLGTKMMEMYTGTVSGLKGAGQGVSYKMVEDGEWHYVVVDILARIGDASTYMVPNEDDTYTIRYLQLRPFAGTQCSYPKDENGVYPQKVMADDYLDIAYIAYCDDLADLKDIIDVETYEWSISSDTSSLRGVNTHACVTHSAKVEQNANGYTVSCGGCGSILKTVSVDESVNWYSSLDGMNRYSATLTKNQFDSENLVMYNRFTDTKPGHLNITGGGGAGTWTADKLETGKYLVIKYRVEGGSFQFYVGTEDHGISPSHSDGRPHYSGLGTVAGAETMSEWRVAVIELSDLDNYTVDSEQQIYIMIASFGTYTFDVAYAAVVDDIDEARTLLDSGENYYYYEGSLSNEGVLNGGAE